MPAFTYRGRDRNGRPVSGELQGDTASTVASQLANLGITPVRIEPAAAEMGAGALRQIRLLTAKPGLTELMLFCRQMNALMKAGIPIVRALRGLTDSSRNPWMVAALNDVIETLGGGRDLAGALAKHPEVFSPLFVNVIRVGENSGRLDEAFMRLYQYMTFEKYTRDRVAAALRYPIIVLVAVGIAIGVIMVAVVPQFTKIFAAFGSELPVPTQIIIAVSNFMTGYWYLLLAALAGAVLLVRNLLAREAGRYWWDRAKLRVPVIGSIVLRGTLARFARAFTMSFRSGMPLLESLSLISHAVNNEYVGAHIRDVRDSVERGETLTRAAAGTRLFTPLVLQMLAVGEETGKLDEMLDEVADYYERDVQADVDNLGAVMEPLLIAIVGLVVLVLALGVFLPMWDLAGAALRKH